MRIFFGHVPHVTQVTARRRALGDGVQLNLEHLPTCPANDRHEQTAPRGGRAMWRRFLLEGLGAFFHHVVGCVVMFFEVVPFGVS